MDGDIYATIANESGVTKGRDAIKEDFMKFVNGSVQNYVYTFFHEHLPALTEMLMKGKKPASGLCLVLLER